MTKSVVGAKVTVAMKEREYKALKTEAEAEYRRKLEAIETVWNMSGGASRNGTEVSGQVFGKGVLLKAVRNALEEIRGDFTVRDIESRIRTFNPTLAATLRRPSLSSTLKRLEESHEVELVLAGSGKRPGKYRRATVVAG